MGKEQSQVSDKVPRRRAATGTGRADGASRPPGVGGGAAATHFGGARSEPAPHPLDIRPSLGAPQVFPGEVAANRRRAIRLCAWTAIVPAVLIGILLGVSVNVIVGVVALVVVGAAVMYGLWRLAPSRRVAPDRSGADRRA